MFKLKKNKTAITPAEKTYSVHYLGSLRTVNARGDDCLEEPVKEIWKISDRGRRSAKAKVTIALAGLNLERSDIKDLTSRVQFFQLHRLSYSGSPKGYSKVFAWVHRNELPRMQVELRVHAVICKKTDTVKEMTSLLTERITTNFQDYKKEMRIRDKLSERRGSEGTTVPWRLMNVKTNYMPPNGRRGSMPFLDGAAELIEIEEEEEVVEPVVEEEEEEEVNGSNASTGISPELESSHTTNVH